MRIIVFLTFCFFAFSAQANSVSELYRAKALFSMDDAHYGEAIKYLDKALKSDKNDALAYLYRGAAYSRMGFSSKALNDLLRAKKKGLDMDMLTYELGVAYFYLQAYDKATPLLEQSLEIHPDHAASYY